MRLAIELYAEKPVFVKENSYFSLGIRSHGLVAEDMVGKDDYKVSCLMGSGKRLAGIGREIQYHSNFFPSGLGHGEARPGAYVELHEDSLAGLALIVETNLILDPALLRDQLGLRLVNPGGKGYDIPLARPDIEVAWNGRGRYVIPVGEFVTSKLFSA